MLNILRSIVQELNGINDLQEALEIIVTRVQSAMQTEVCSVYLLDPESNRYILMATEGLYKSAVGQVTLGHSEGLVGLVGSREEPINLEDATTHPRYRYFPETGEERFRSFLGVPIIHHRRVLGVIVVQERQNSRCFDEGEEAFLVTISAQLAGVIAHSEATGAIGGMSLTGQSTRDVAFSGVAGAPGVSVGQGVVIFPPADLDSVPDKSCENIDEELARFNEAVAAVREDIQRVGERLAPQLRPEEQALFEVYLRMLDDNALPGEVVLRIQEGKWAQGGLREVVNQYVRHFELMGDLYLRERAVDIRDLGRRLLSHLQEGEPLSRAYPERTILVSDELTPAMLGDVPQGQLVGLVSVRGSSN
ncbi:MAG: GAF domain-containing protein, partial [Halomonadaceae bacterium]